MSANPLAQPSSYTIMPGTSAATGQGGDMPSATMDQGTTVVRDGTSGKVVGMALAAAATLVLLKYAGFQFHVGVSN